MDPLFTDVLYLILAVGILWKCADWFVEGAVALARKLAVPQMLVGLVIVSITTTSPELMASVLAALRGMPAVALGNAIGSVIVDASLALGLAALLASAPLLADKHLFRVSACMLVIVIPLSFAMCFDGTLARTDGAILLGVYAAYVVVSYVLVRRRPAGGGIDLTVPEMDVGHLSGRKVAALFLGGFLGVLGGSHLLLEGAMGIAERAGLSEVVIGLTVVAIGTSMPEIATCVAAAIKKHSGIGLGNILGADILNICWVAGLSSLANPLHAERQVIYVMYPAVVIVVGTMLLMLRRNYSLKRWNGAVLLTLYVCYMAILFVVAPSGHAAVAPAPHP